MSAIVSQLCLKVLKGEDVMLKFIRDRDAFNCEVEKRALVRGGVDEQGICRVVSIMEHHELAPGTLANHTQVRLATADVELLYLIVMPLGLEDLSDGKHWPCFRSELKHLFIQKLAMEHSRGLIRIELFE